MPSAVRSCHSSSSDREGSGSGKRGWTARMRMRMVMMMWALVLGNRPAPAFVVVVGYTTTTWNHPFRSCRHNGAAATTHSRQQQASYGSWQRHHSHTPRNNGDSSSSSVAPSSSSTTSSTTSSTSDMDAALQWQLFQEHHALGSWKGLWTTYDAMGDVIDEVMAAVHLHPSRSHTSDNHNNNNQAEVVHRTHEIAIGATRSNCAACFDSLETRTIPVSTYQPHTLLPKKMRFAACGMVVGPRILRSSGAMATELAVRFGDGRVRVVLQHAPVWLRRNETDSTANAELSERTGPPDGLKVARVLLSREAIRDNPPTPESEGAALETSVETNSAESSDDGQGTPTPPTFYRPVPPFAWNRLWGGGTSWTWGVGAGNQGWSIDALPDGDDWHGSAAPGLWNLRVPGSPITLQSTTVVIPGEVALVRLAWMPDNDHLLRLEAGFVALEPMNDDNNDDNDELVVALAPPRLVSLRCDVLRNLGELEG